MNALRNFTASLGFKIVGLMTILALTTAAAITVGLLAFGDTKRLVDRLVNEQVAVLAESTRLMADLSQMERGFAAALEAQSEESLTAQVADLAPVTQGLQAQIQNASDPAIRAKAPEVEATSQRINDMVAARKDEFARMAQINDTLNAMEASSQRIAELTAEASDTAYFDLVVGGDDTVERVKGTLTQLIDTDVRTIQMALSVRVEVNVLRGVLLALGANPDPSRRTVLTDIATAALNRLATYQENLAALNAGAERAEAVAMITTDMREVLAQPTRALALSPPLLEAMETLNRDIAIWEDDLDFTLEISAIEAAETNEASILRLISQNVEPLRRLAELDAGARSTFAAAVGVASAGTVDELRLANTDLINAAQSLTRSLDGEEGALATEIMALLAFADPETGLSARQANLLAARAAAFDASEVARENVADLTGNALAQGIETLDNVTSAGQTIQQVVSTSVSQLWTISAICLVLVLVAPVVAWLTAIRPIGRATQTTARLAAGDLTAVDQLPRGRGEIGQLVDALHVFRDNLKEKARMEDEERRNAEQQAARALAEERAASERAMAEAQAKADQEKADRARVQAEEAEKKRLRDLADATRQQLMDAQNRVVDLLAQGLRDLADGNLYAEIKEPFSDGFDQLRQDYNLAVSRLRTVVTSILETAESINGGAVSVTSVADDLARRTESSAATLEESSAALSELTKLVKGTAVRTGDARHIAGDANSKSMEGRQTVQKAMVAMQSISESSSRISRIVELIEGIAFQTNLLALNAGVEAARAGESGRGFAVVASEVRALSQRTTQAAQEISGLITQSRTEVDEGVKMVAEVDLSLSAILTSIAVLEDRIGEISASANEQSVGLTEIDSAVSQMDSNTQQNAAIVEETLAAGQILSAEASRLVSMLGQFTLSSADASGYRGKAA